MAKKSNKLFKKLSPRHSSSENIPEAKKKHVWIVFAPKLSVTLATSNSCRDYICSNVWITLKQRRHRVENLLQI